MEHWINRIWRGLEHSSLVDWVVFPHISGLHRFSAFCCHHCLRPETTPCCKFRLLTNTLANHTGVMLVSVRTKVYTPVCPRRDSKLCPHHWHWSTITDIDSRACLVPRHRQVGEFYQAHLWMCVNIIGLSADANPQFRRGSVADSPHTSPLSLSSNSRVTVMSYQDRQIYADPKHCN